MTRRKATGGLDFEALRVGIERCDPNVLLAFYTEEASLMIVNAKARSGVPFELRGKAEIAKHLRVVFGQKMPHRVERAVVGEERMTFRETCEYPDGDRVVVETTLEVESSKIVRQVDVVASDARADSQEGSGRGPPPRSTSAGVDAPLPNRHLRPKQMTEKED
jgi:hypothetical protein